MCSPLCPFAMLGISRASSRSSTTAAEASGWGRDKLVHNIVEPLPSNAILMISWLNSFQTLSRRSSTMHACSDLRLSDSPQVFPVLVNLDLTGHGSSNFSACLSWYPWTQRHQPPPGPRVSVWRFFIHFCELRETGPMLRQIPATNVPIIASTAFQQHSQCRVRPPENVKVSEWNWECFFLRHKERNPWFRLMTTNVLSLDGPKNRFRFHSHPPVCPAFETHPIFLEDHLCATSSRSG